MFHISFNNVVKLVHLAVVVIAADDDAVVAITCMLLEMLLLLSSVVWQYSWCIIVVIVAAFLPFLFLFCFASCRGMPCLLWLCVSPPKKRVMVK